MTQNVDIPRQLSPWNPLDHLRLLWWVLVTPQRLLAYREVFGENAERSVSKWLISAIACLPLILINVAQVLGTLTRSESLATHIRNSIGWIMVGVLSGWLTQKKNTWAQIVLFFVSSVLKIYLTFIISSFVACVVLLLTILLGITSKNTHTVMFMITLVLAFLVIAMTNTRIENEIKESQRTGRPSPISRGVFTLCLAAYIFLIWFSFLGGWRVFQ